jgi:LysM repeat protein
MSSLRVRAGLPPALTLMAGIGAAIVLGGCAGFASPPRANLSGPQKAGNWPAYPLPAEGVGQHSAMREEGRSDRVTQGAAVAPIGSPIGPPIGPMYAPGASRPFDGPRTPPAPTSVVTAPLPPAVTAPVTPSPPAAGVGPIAEAASRPTVAGASARATSVGYVSGRLPTKPQENSPASSDSAVQPALPPPAPMPVAVRAVATTPISAASPQASPPATAPQPTRTPTAGRPNVIVTEPGETLLEVASRHRVSVAALMSTNGLTRLDVPPGTRLTIPRR